MTLAKQASSYLGHFKATKKNNQVIYNAWINWHFMTEQWWLNDSMSDIVEALIGVRINTFERLLVVTKVTCEWNIEQARNKSMYQKWPVVCGSSFDST